MISFDAGVCSGSAVDHKRIIIGRSCHQILKKQSFCCPMSTVGLPEEHLAWMESLSLSSTKFDQLELTPTCAESRPRADGYGFQVVMRELIHDS